MKASTPSTSVSSRTPRSRPINLSRHHRSTSPPARPECRPRHDSRSPHNQFRSIHSRRALEDAIDRSDRQLVNSVNRTWRQSRPTTSREWSPAERFVSGSAPAGATRPFVDVQSVLCRLRSIESHPHQDRVVVVNSQYKQPLAKEKQPNSQRTS